MEPNIQMQVASTPGGKQSQHCMSTEERRKLEVEFQGIPRKEGLECGGGWEME